VINKNGNHEIYISQEQRIDRIAEMFNITTAAQHPLPVGADGDRVFEYNSIAETDTQQQSVLRDVNADSDLPDFKSYNEIRTYFRSYTGNLVYLTQYGRPDVQAIVYRLARYQQFPSLVHIKAVRHVISYLLHTKSKRLTFGRQKMKDILCCFSDSSYADCVATARSTGGYVHFLFGNYLSSRSFKINCVTRSVTEAEFYTLSAAAADSIYFRDFYNETLRPFLAAVFGRNNNASTESMVANDLTSVSIAHSGFAEHQKVGETLLSKAVHPWTWMEKSDTVIYGDNKSSLSQANYGSNKRSKHIRIHNSYIWEQIHVFKTVRVGKVDTKENCADMQTKCLDEKLFQYHTSLLMGERTHFEVNTLKLYTNGKSDA
jgi:hypothetical protein